MAQPLRNHPGSRFAPDLALMKIRSAIGRLPRAARGRNDRQYGARFAIDTGAPEGKIAFDPEPSEEAPMPTWSPIPRSRRRGGCLPGW